MWVLLFLLLLTIVIITIRDKKPRDKTNNGYIIVDNVLLDDDIRYINKCWDNLEYKRIVKFLLRYNRINDMIKTQLGEDYVLINYSYLIQNSSIHTYHRDYTSSKNYNNLEYPSYTMILYLDDSNVGLNLIPGSHIDKSLIYMQNSSVKPNIRSGTIIVFDADILHAGTKTNADRRCIQFKIIHKQDIDKLVNLNNYHVLIDKPNNKADTLAFFETFVTRHFPFIMDMNNQNIKTSFLDSRTPFQKFVSGIVFSDQEFYKPIHIK